MNPAILNHLWQSTALVCAVALLTLGFRKNRAGVRYWLWWSASIKFLLPLTLLTTAASHIEVAPTAHFLPPAAASAVIVEISEPFSPAQPLPPTHDWMPAAILIVWTLGVIALAALRVRSYLHVRAAVRDSTPLAIDAPIPVRCTTARLEPGVAGFWRPVLLLPEGIVERLTTSQLDSILAHEVCHVRRRDNLTAAVHMLVETLFWFHPLVWWAGARLIEERERACDEAVIAAGGDPRDYARAIYNVCRFYVESPLTCVSGVSGADVKKRVRAILTGAVVRDLNAVQKLWLAFAAAAVLAVPFLIGLVSARSLRAQAPSAPTKFEVASIRPCQPGDSSGDGRKGQKKGGGGGPSTSPGTLITGCETVESLIRSAYVLYATGRPNRDPSNPPLEGGPAWIHTARYQIQAKAEGAPGAGIMNGPLMRVLLEERFKLKVHRSTKEVPVYALTVAKGGPRLTSFVEGSCKPIEFGTIPPPGEPICRVGIRQRGPNLAIEGKGSTLREIVKLLYLIVDRPVIDRTGIQDRFDFDVEFAPEQAPTAFRPPGDPPPPPPASTEEPTARIYTAFEEKLGLKLESAKGPREYVVIDHVERPTRN
ncbi:MAG TPA: M56 family metallopeptidase [Candidatus Acidoferrum sp.]|nr:M56 family metallopeptidase [Candidatus Acidoferrum sp.]